MTMKKLSQTKTKSEALEIAKGLYESKVCVQRPPTLEQKGAYHIPWEQHSTRPLSAEANVSTERTSNLSSVPPRKPKPQLPWRPFSSTSLSYRCVPLSNVSFKDEKQTESSNMVPEVYKDRVLPKGLSNLKTWLTAEMKEDWSAAYRPENSFVFLPSLECRTESLPCVPPEQSPEEQLVYIPDRKTYRPPRLKSKKVVEIYEPPKLKSKKVVECEVKEEGKTTRTRSLSGTKSSTSESDFLSLSSSSSGQMKFHFKDGDPLDRINKRKWKAAIIRKELRELENLLRGTGNPKGSSLISRYQHDITHLKDMANTTLKACHRLPEVEPETFQPSVQSDLSLPPKRDEDFVTRIMRRRNACVEELAVIEKRIMGKKRR